MSGHKTEATGGQQAQPRAVRGAAWVLLNVAILSSTTLYALDNTLLANIRPPIIDTFGHIEKLPWISVAYALGELSSNPIWGTLYGILDNKILYCLSVLIFDAGSALCGAAPSPDALIVGRVIAGVGGSGIYIGTLNILSALTLVSERAQYLSYVGVAWCLGTIIGPIIGGAFAVSTATWRWSFYINLCISAAAAPAYLWLLPRNPSALAKQSNGRIRRLDYAGAVLFVGSILTLIMAISFGGSVYPWSSGQVIGLLVATAVLWILLSVQQGLCIFTSRLDRLFPCQFFKEKEMCLIFAETAIGISCVVVPIYFLPLFFQFIRGDSALMAGVRTLPFIFAAVVGCMLNGALFKNFSLYLLWFSLGTALAMLGAGLLLLIDPSISDAKIYGFSIIIGLGGGLFAQAGYAVGQAIQPAAIQAKVTAFLSCAQMTGVALSIGIGTALFVNQAAARISDALPGLSDEDIQQTIAGTGSSLLSNLNSEESASVLAALAQAIRVVFLMVVVVSGVGLLLSFFMRKTRLFGDKAVTTEAET